jgi:hypothetical protein
MAPRSKAEAENSLVMRTVLIAGLVLTGLFVLCTRLETSLARLAGPYADEIVVALMLLSLWLCVGAAVRSMHRLRKDMPLLKLLAGGVLTALLATVLYAGYLLFFPKVSKAGEAASMAGAVLILTLLFGGAGFIISAVSIIRLKVKNSTVAGLIEFVLVMAGVAAFVYLTGR